MQNFYDQFDACREHDIPMCADACPFRIDILDLQERITKKRFNAAYKSIRDKVAFPAIVCEICPAYCEKACIRQIIDSPLQIRRLEKSVIELASRKSPNRYNLPAKHKKIAVIGAGLSGMGFAFRMASKKYDVTIFEKTDRIGGSLSELLPEETYMAEFDLQFTYENYNLKLNSEINDISPLCITEDNPDGFDVIYVATGKDGNSFDVPFPDADSEDVCGCMSIGDTAIYIGGQLCGRDPVQALSDGLEISNSAEVFLKIKKLEYPQAPEPTKCVANEDKLSAMPAVASENEILSEEQCIAEAERCIKCQCDSCATYCDLIGYFDKWPAKMRDEILLSCKPAGSLVHKAPARKYIAVCTECHMMTDTCPEHIDLCGMIKLARHKMHDADKVPAAYKQYFLRDMEFANGEYAALTKIAPGSSSCKYAFFPGCSLGALNPDYVLKSYRWLLDKYSDTGLLLRCCNVPVDWAGNSEIHDRETALLKQEWEALGKPTLITACMSCSRHLNEYLPEIETVSLYEIMAKDFDKAAFTTDTEYAVFDPCSARDKAGVQEAVRALADKAGIPAAELPKGDKHGCCGFGGQGSMVLPEFTDYVTQKRSELSDKPYLVYCSNCRDIFKDEGKPAVHILDILFDIDPKNTLDSPDVTQRRTNRTILKEKLLKEIWGEEMNSKPEKQAYNLIMTDEIAKKVNKLKILEDDICNVISHAETTGRRTVSPDTKHYKAYYEIGAITVWVEYTNGKAPEDRIIHNVYSHRMQIQLEAVFNGRKIDM